MYQCFDVFDKLLTELGVIVLINFQSVQPDASSPMHVSTNYHDM